MGNNLGQTRIGRPEIRRSLARQLDPRFSPLRRAQHDIKCEADRWRGTNTPVAKQEVLAEVPQSGTQSPLDSSIHPPVLLTMEQKNPKAKSGPQRRHTHQHSLQPSPQLQPQPQSQSQIQTQTQTQTRVQVMLQPKSESPQRRAKKLDLFQYVPLYKGQEEAAQDTFHERMMTQQKGDLVRHNKQKEREVDEATPSTRATTPFTPLARRSLPSTQVVINESQVPTTNRRVVAPEDRGSYGQLARPLRCRQVFVRQENRGDHKERRNSVDVADTLKPLESQITPILQKRVSCTPVKPRSHILPFHSDTGLAPPQARRSLPVNQPSSLRVLALARASKEGPSLKQFTGFDRPLALPATPSLGTSSNSNSNLNTTRRQHLPKRPKTRGPSPNSPTTEGNRGLGPPPGPQLAPEAQAQAEPKHKPALLKEEERSRPGTSANKKRGSWDERRPRLMSPEAAPLRGLVEQCSTPRTPSTPNLRPSKKADSVYTALSAEQKKKREVARVKRVRESVDAKLNVNVVSAADKKRVWKGQKGVFRDKMLRFWFIHMNSD